MGVGDAVKVWITFARPNADASKRFDLLSVSQQRLPGLDWSCKISP